MNYIFLKNKLRRLAACFFAKLPTFKGSGRLILLIDSCLTNYSNPDSYMVLGFLNGDKIFSFDLRPWTQKFAYYYRRLEYEHIETIRKLYYGGIFIDIGSSIGLYVVCMSDIVRRNNSSILSFEPVLFNLERQKNNVRLNNAEDIVKYFPCALGANKTSVMIRTDPSKSDNNAIIADDGDLKIDVIPLDDLMTNCDARIGMIKIDVEGYEPQVIEGARWTIRKYKPLIFAEFNRERMDINGYSMDGTWNFLVHELNYTCYVLDIRSNRLQFLDQPGRFEDLYFIPRTVCIPKDLIR